MCGLTGYWYSNAAPDSHSVKLMVSELAHRGPDDSGYWLDKEAGLALAHQRLAILDLSQAGHQPMQSPCGRYVLVYNGEIYNHLEMRKHLDSEGGGFKWRGHSDTETLLAAIRHWGVQNALNRLNGMFAFALWDKTEKKLYLARDRMGEKPLYYGHSSGRFLFGSELKSLTANPDWQGEVDRNALAAYLRFGYVPTPGSIYKNIWKLPAAHYIVVTEGGKNISDPVCYWDLNRVAGSRIEQGSLHESDLTNALEDLLSDAVKSRMISDVPLGAFLSGGYDSSTIVALMQMQSTQPVKTFSIGFGEAGYDEAVHARSVAKYLGTDHSELYVTPEEAMAVIPHIPRIWDEPFADASQIPTYLVSKLAKQKVTVSLSGDGGDELFCGYNRYTLGYNIWKAITQLPGPVRRGLQSLLHGASTWQLDKLVQLLPPRYRVAHLSDRLLKLSDVMQYDSELALYQALLSHWKTPENLVIDGREPDTVFADHGELKGSRNYREQMMLLDAKTYLPDDILTKVDRASMAVGLEARVPLLDHRLVEFAWSLPMSLKYRDGKGKWLLRQVLYRHVPPSLVDRPKMGFTVPIEQWLRGPLRDWAEDLLDESRLKQEGYLDPTPIRKCWLEHITGKRRWHEPLWTILMFQAWLEHNNA